MYFQLMHLVFECNIFPWIYTFFVFDILFLISRTIRQYLNFVENSHNPYILERLSAGPSIVPHFNELGEGLYVEAFCCLECDKA